MSFDDKKEGCSNSKKRSLSTTCFYSIVQVSENRVFFFFFFSFCFEEADIFLLPLYGASVAHSLLCQDKSLAQIDVLNHMGYTWDVHKDFFRKYDSVGERLEVAKLLMLQDQNKLNEYRDNGLAQIDVRQLAAAQFQGKECLSYSSLLSLFVDI